MIRPGRTLSCSARPYLITPTSAYLCADKHMDEHWLPGLPRKQKANYSGVPHIFIYYLEKTLQRRSDCGRDSPKIIRDQAGC
jgi:hypothetical protein